MSVQTTSPASPLLATSRAGAVFLAVIAPLGPLLMALHLVVTPWVISDDIPASTAAIVANPAGAQLSVLIISLSAVFGAAGSLVVGAAIRAGSPRFGAVAAAIAFVGYVVAAYPGPIAAIAASGSAGLSEQQTLDLVAGVDGQVQGIVVGVLFVCLPAGSLLLGIGALIAARRGRYPLWAAILLAASIPLVIVGGLMPGRLVVIGWVVLAVAYAVAGVVYASAFASGGRARAASV